MAEELRTENTSNITTTSLLENNLLELQCLIKTTGICQSARCEIGHGHLLAFTTKYSNIGLFYQSDNNDAPIIKQITWFHDPNRAITALCFDPTGSWLLTACVDGTLYIVPGLTFLNERHVNDKWPINDITPIKLVDQESYSRPSALTWWQGVTQCSYIGIVGTEEGEVILINLENGQWIGSTRIRGGVASLDICQDNSLEIVSLLITNRSQQQWRLILKQHANNAFAHQSDRNFTSFHLSKYESCVDEGKTIFPPVRSRLQGLKQLSVEKLSILKQKLAETRSRNVNSGCHTGGNSSGSSDGIPSSASVMKNSSPRIKNCLFTLEPLSEDMLLSPQYTRQGQHLYTAYCKTTNHVTIHGTDNSVVPSHMYKMPDVCEDILLTEKLFFTIGSDGRSLWVISCPLCEVKISDTSQFNSQAVIARFQFDNTKEVIKNIYRLSAFNDTANVNYRGDNKQHILPKKIHHVNVQVAPIDTCLVVTNCGVYRVVIRKPLLTTFLELALNGNRNDIDKATRLATIFGMNVLELFESAGDIHLANGRFTKAATLYKLSRCRLLKGVLKTAATGHTAKLLECLNHCLTPPAVSELTTTMRIHLSNLTVFAFSELILRASPREANNLYKHFLLFLSKNLFYDERWVVDVMGQTCLWKILHHLATQRGLCVQVLDVLIKTVQSYGSTGTMMTTTTMTTTLPVQTKYGLLICISEPSLLQALLTIPHLATSHMKFIHANISVFHVFVLERLVTLYDPTNPEFRPQLVRYRSRHRTTSHSSQSSQCDSIDSSDLLEENVSQSEEFLETFIFILLTLIGKRRKKYEHNSALVGRTHLPAIENRSKDMGINVDFKRRLLAAGYGHVALIRNGNVYTWGNAGHGCLGTGPSISRYGAPQAVTIFRSMEIQVLSVSCGRCHTLAVTNNGLYAWGGNQYGQLGLGRTLQTPNPKLIVRLANEIVVDAVAGQYHSVALTTDGRVFTWGWGVHGQLGHGTIHHENIPTLVEALLGTVVRTIAAGHAHTLVLTADGMVYAFGCNIFGQLGNGTNVKSSLPVKISLLTEPIVDIATGYFHNLAVSSTNKLYTWGSSPQVLRLQTQAQKKSKLQEFQAAAEKYAVTLEEFNASNCKGTGSNNIPPNLTNLTAMEKLAINTINERKLQYYPNVAKSISLKDINLGLLEETQNHLKPALVDTSLVNGRIVHISTGCHHSALLTKDGTVYCWGRNLDGQIGNGTRRDVNIPTPLTYNPVSVLGNIPPRNINRPNDDGIGHGQSDNMNNKTDEIHRLIKAIKVCCGCEFTVAIQPGGTVLSWGSNSVAQLGRPPTKESSSVAEKLVLIKSSKRVVRLPHGAHIALDTPSQVPNIPIPIITYQSYDVTPLAGRIRSLSTIEKSYDELTLHYVLEQFYGLYDVGKIMNKCDELGNYQAYSKLALLEQNIPLALLYQLKTLDSKQERIMSVHDADDDIDSSSKCMEKIEKNTELFVKQMEKNLVDTIDECETKKKMTMSTSRSLDSINFTQAQELYTFDCQGGSEELCDDTKSEDISLDLTDGALDNDVDTELSINFGNSNNKQSHTASNNIFLENNSEENSNNDNENKSSKCPRVIVSDDTLNALNFYITEVDESSRTVLHQILQTIFNYWIDNKLPQELLENFLLKHMNKLFYSLGLILFCQNDMSDDVDTNRNATQVQAPINTQCLSTKFRLQVCSMILEQIDKDECSPNFVELFSSLTSKHYGSPPSDYLATGENAASPQQLMKGIISTISSKSIDARPYIHIKDPEKVSQLLDFTEDIVVFTCGHYFPLSVYQSEIIPHMEAELLMSQPSLFPCTAQVLEKLLSRIFKLEIVCPQCIPRAINATVNNLMDT